MVIFVEFVGGVARICSSGRTVAYDSAMIFQLMFQNHLSICCWQPGSDPESAAGIEAVATEAQRAVSKTSFGGSGVGRGCGLIPCNITWWLNITLKHQANVVASCFFMTPQFIQNILLF